MDTVYHEARALARRLRLGRLATPPPYQFTLGPIFLSLFPLFRHSPDTSFRWPGRTPRLELWATVNPSGQLVGP